MNEHLEPGCYIDGHWGQYGPDRLIDLATELGWQPSTDRDRILVDVAKERLANIGPNLGAFNQHEWITFTGNDHDREFYDVILEEVIELSQDVEDDLNNDFMPEGLRCGWSDGEFFIMPDEWWEENE